MAMHILIHQLMRVFSRGQTLHHFKIFFPVPVEKIQNCLKQLQHLNHTNTSAVCISLNGHSESPESCQLLHDGLLNLRDANRLSVFAFLEDKATALTYFTATAAQTVTANPYALIGEVGTTQKSYRNIRKLLELVGVKYSELGRSESSLLWNQFAERTDREQKITEKWLATVEKNMVDSVAHRRNIPRDHALAIRSRLFLPRDALAAKLIDAVSTFEEFAATNYPNHAVEDVVYRLDGTRLRPTLTQKELSAISALLEVVELPSVALVSSEDLLASALRELWEAVEARVQAGSLEELQAFLECALEQAQLRAAQEGLLL